jgi:Na+/melibiose symporter-like transporter
VRAVRHLLASNRNLRLLLASGLISLTGDWILRVGLTYEVYALTGSTLASGALLATSLVPQLVLGSPAGVFVDRWDRRRTMIAVDLLLAASLLPLLAVRSADDVWIVYPVSFAAAVLVQFLTPAEASMAPLLVPADRLVTANALIAQSRDVARLAGSALGGVLAAAGGISLVGGADVGSFLVAAVAVALIGAAPGAAPGSAPSPVVRPGLRAEWIDGLRIAIGSPAVRLLLAVTAVSDVGEGIMGTLFAPFVRTRLHGNAAAFGTIVSAQAIGGIVGGLVVAVAADRIAPWAALGGGAVAFGLIDLSMFLYPLGYAQVWPAIALMIVVGVPGALIVVALATIFQGSTLDAHRGRVFGALATVGGAATLVGIALGSALPSRLGIVSVLTIDAACYTGCGLVVLLLVRSGRLTPAGGGATPAAPARSTPASRPDWS